MYVDNVSEKSQRRSVSINTTNMSQDITSDALNQMMNTLKSGKNEVTVKKHSKLLISVLAVDKLKGYVSDYTIDGNSLKIKIGKLNDCNAIKPRFFVKSDEYEKFVKRYLPAKSIGMLIVSTSSGLMTHHTAEEKKKGGCLLAYFY